MTSIQISNAAKAWENLQHYIPFSAIHSEEQYEPNAKEGSDIESLPSFLLVALQSTTNEVI